MKSQTDQMIEKLFPQPESDAPEGVVEPGENHFDYVVAIEVFNMDTFKTKLQILNRKATKYGLPEIVYAVLAEHTYEREDSEGIYHSYDVQLTGGAIEVPGNWTLVGVIDHKENLIRSVPGQYVPPHFRDTGPVCDHCHTIRDRNETFIVSSYVPMGGDTRYQQVGRTCLRDFMGIYPARALAQFDIIREIQEEEFVGSRTPLGYNLEIYLACVIRTIRDNGWVSKTSIANGLSQPGIRSTADHAYATMIERPKSAISDIPRFSEVDREMSKEVIAWASSLAEDTNNEYMQNLRQIAINGFVTPSSLGFAASMVVTYNKHMEQLLAARNSASKHLGTIKQRITFQAQVTSQPSFASEWGTTYYHRMLTADGCIVEWRTSKMLELGKWYEITGTVKAHGFWNGIAETSVTNCRTVVEIGALNVGE
jgi:hypothetical protein